MPSPILNNQSARGGFVHALVDSIQRDPYNPPEKRSAVLGWDERIKTYSYAVRGAPMAWPKVFRDTGPLIRGLARIVQRYNWGGIHSANDLAQSDYDELKDLAEGVCKWGGVRQRHGYGDVWSVIKSAVLDARHHNARMNSGWTKVASFATDSRANAQTIWDSRVSTSIVWRFDQLLQTHGLQPAVVLQHWSIGLVRGRASRAGGPRARSYHFQNWPNGYGKWRCHLAGSQLVREMVDVLNNPHLGYPRMPMPDGTARPWDVFGVGLVLFMDGY